MRIIIEVPKKDYTLGHCCIVRLAPNGESWSETQLGEHAKSQGCYVIHRGGSVLYIGKTDGPTMTFGTRLRREFQETASQGRHIYPKLAALTKPPEIQASFLTLPQIRDLVFCEEANLDDFSKIAIAEQTLIQIYQPEFQIRKNSSRIKKD